MEWDELQGHFERAVTQEPLPGAECVEGQRVLEWDQSRYARALGQTDLPGLHDLEFSGCAVVAARGAEARYRGWAEAAGWGFERIGARSTVMAPDGFVYGLGDAGAGAAGWVF